MSRSTQPPSRPSLTFAASGIAARMQDRSGLRLLYAPLGSGGYWYVRAEGNVTRLVLASANTRAEAVALLRAAGWRVDCYGKVTQVIERRMVTK